MRVSEREKDPLSVFTAEELKAPGNVGVNTLTQAVLEYLRMGQMLRDGKTLPVGWHYSGMEDFLLKHGRFWTPRTLPSHICRMQRNMCFTNVFRLVSRRRDLRYVEGVAVGVIPVHHAWAVDADGNVIDPTWASTAVDLGDVYFGVPFSLDRVRLARQRPTKMACVFYNDFSIYEQPFTVE